MTQNRLSRIWGRFASLQPRDAVAPQVLQALAAAAMRAQAQRAAAALALREAARSRQFGDPSTSLGEVPPYSRTEVPRGVAADQAVLERFALFDALSERNNAEQVAVIEFKAGDYRRIGELPVTRVGVISREQAQQFCRHLPTVQKALDTAVKECQRNPTLRSTDPARIRHARCMRRRRNYYQRHTGMKGAESRNLLARRYSRVRAGSDRWDWMCRKRR